MSTTTMHPVVETWVRQLLEDPQVLQAIELAGEGKLSITFYANGGRCRKQPVIVINGGAGELT